MTTLSRRRFAQLLGVGAACAMAKPVKALARASAEPAAGSLAHTGTKAGPIRLSANENPYGPSSKALKAMGDSYGLACRYPDEFAEPLAESLASLNGVSRDQILLGDGSGEILKICAETFTGPARNGDGGRALVVADPTFEAILHHATMNGAEVIKVPLAEKFGHDLAKMQPASAGLVYICNPNNPTATITPKNELRDFMTKAPAQMMILVDEAYFHYAESPEYETVIPLIKDHPNLIVARTFSKIYGMAGLRCGYCVAQRATIEKMRPYQMWDSVNIMALAAAHASLNDPGQVTNGRRLNSEAKAYVTSALDGLGFKLLPSQANFVMIDLQRPVVPLIEALKQRSVQVGRLFPAMPNHMRLTIGKKSEMEAFVAAFKQAVA